MLSKSKVRHQDWPVFGGSPATEMRSNNAKEIAAKSAEIGPDRRLVVLQIARGWTNMRNRQIYAQFRAISTLGTSRPRREENRS